MLGGRVVDRLGAELALDPGRQADRANTLEVAGPCPVGEPVESVSDLTIGGERRAARRRVGHSRPRRPGAPASPPAAAPQGGPREQRERSLRPPRWPLPCCPCPPTPPPPPGGTR